MWGAQLDIDDPAVLGPIHRVQSEGGQMVRDYLDLDYFVILYLILMTQVIATGGAVGPYLEHVCGTSEALATAYKVALDVVGTTHLDIDIEAPINNDLVNR